MSRIILSDSGDWRLRFPDDQDIRGYPVVDKFHEDTGLYVEDMVVDTDQEMVDAVILSDGSEYPARDISIGDNVVYATADAIENGRLTSEIANYGKVTRHDRVSYDESVIVRYEPDYRTHYGSEYEASGRSYDTELMSAYKYGTAAAYRDGLRNRSFRDAEDDLRSDYRERFANRDFDEDRQAIRFGFSRAQRGPSRAPAANAGVM